MMVQFSNPKAQLVFNLSRLEFAQVVVLLNEIYTTGTELPDHVICQRFEWTNAQRDMIFQNLFHAGVIEFFVIGKTVKIKITQAGEKFINEEISHVVD